MESDQNQKRLNRLGTIMICYAIIALAMLVLRSWNILDISLFILNAISFCLFQFTRTSKKVCAVINIVTGFASLFLLAGIIIIYGAYMGIYSIIFLTKYKEY